MKPIDPDFPLWQTVALVMYFVVSGALMIAVGMQYI